MQLLSAKMFKNENKTKNTFKGTRGALRDRWAQEQECTYKSIKDDGDQFKKSSVPSNSHSHSLFLHTHTFSCL